MLKVPSVVNALLLSACSLVPVAAAAEPAPSVLYNPRIVSSTVVLTGVESRLRFHPSRWDSSLTATHDLGDVGATADISNNLATLLNTVYAFNLSFNGATKLLTWTIWGGELTAPSVLTVTEDDAFNAIRFNAQTNNPAHTMTFTDLSFNGLPGSGILRTSGMVTNRIDSQRIVAASGLLSDADWDIGGNVSTNGTTGPHTKIWIASQNVQLLPSSSAAAAPFASPVPEPSTVLFLAGGLALLGWRHRARRPG